jgi:FimV-like protein
MEASSDDPLETKFLLAEEFRSLGDTDGARSLAEEVLAEAKGPLKVKAQAFLNALSERSLNAPRSRVPFREDCTRRQLQRQRPTRAGKASFRATRAGQAGTGAGQIRRPAHPHPLRRPHRRRRARPDAGGALRHSPAARHRLLGARHQRLFALRHRRAVGARSPRPIPLPRQCHRAPLCLCGAGVAGAPQRGSRARRLGLPASGWRGHAAGRHLPGRRARFQLFPGRPMPGQVPRQNHQPYRDFRARRPGPGIGASSSRPTPFCTT